MEKCSQKKLRIQGLFTVFASLAFLSKANGRSHVYLVPSRSILPEHVFKNYTNVNSSCECREIALSIPGCTGASVYDRGDGINDCLVSKKQLLGFFDMKPNTAVFTVRNQATPKCVDPFKLTEVGCIMLVEELLLVTDSRKKCQSLDADLAVMETGSQRSKLWSILKTVYNQPDWFYFWVGIEKSKWLTGVPVEGFLFPNSCGTIYSNGLIFEASMCVGAFYSVCQRFVYE